jgi:hypothetical protein
VATERNCEAIGHKPAKYRPESAANQSLKFQKLRKNEKFLKILDLHLDLNFIGNWPIFWPKMFKILPFLVND